MVTGPNRGGNIFICKWAYIDSVKKRLTFAKAVWNWIRRWSKKTLEKAGERVADVQGDDDDFEEEPTTNDTAQSTARDSENSTARQRNEAL